MSDDAKPGRVLGPSEETIAVRRELPHWASRALGLFLIALGAGAVLLAIFVPFPEVVEASFVLVPVRGADPIRSPIRGSSNASSPRRAPKSGLATVCS